MRRPAVARAALVAAAGVAIVVGSQRVDTTWDVGAGGAPVPDPAAVAAPSGGRSPVEGAVISCAGPEQQGVRGSGAGGTEQSVRAFAATPPAEVLAAGDLPEGPGRLEMAPQPAAEQQDPSAADDASTEQRGERVTARVRGAQSVAVTGTGPLAPGVAGMQYHVNTEPERRALMIAACGAPAAESWLLAGAAEPGRQERLVLVNPGANPVTADVEVLGAAGPVEASSGRGVVVPGHGRTVLLLDALAGAEQSPAVHVSAHGGQLFTALGDNWLEGILDRGGDLTTASAPPAGEQVVPAVPVDGRAVLRVAVPGEEEAVAEIRALTGDGPLGVDRDVVRVPARSVLDIDVSDLPTGTHALQVRADEPVVAAASVQRRVEPDGVSDLAWTPSQAPLDALGGTPLLTVEGTVNRLTVASTGAASPATVTTVAVDGRTAQRSLDLAADSAVTLDLGQAASVWVRADRGRVRGAVVTTVGTEDGELIAAMPLPDLLLSRPETVLRPLQP